MVNWIKILGVLLILFCTKVLGQGNDILTKDSIDINALYLEIHPVYDLDFYTIEYLDTLIDKVHLFYPNETEDFLRQFAPVMGQNLLPLQYKTYNSIEFKNGYNFNSPYKLDLKSNPFYQNNAPYSFAKYILGGEENIFTVKHAQNVAKPIDIAVQYNNINSPGTYQRQITSINNLGANAWFNLPNIRYQALISYIWNRQNRQLNGGVIDDVFGESSIIQAEADVFLNNAEERLIDKHLFFQHSIDFGPKRDSLDTQDSVYVEWIEPKWRLFHQFNLNDNERYYNDSQSDTTYYSNFLVDENSTQDSLFLTKYHNKMGISWLGKINNKYSGIKAQIALNHEAIKQLQTSTNDSTTYGNIFKDSGFWLSTNAITDTALSKHFNFKATLDYGLSGWHQNTLNSEVNVNSYFKQFKLNVSAAYTIQNPAHLYSQFISNHFNWDNDLKKIKTLNLAVKASLKKDLVTASYQYISQVNPTFLAENALPKQSSEALNLHSIETNIKLKFKWFYFQSANYLQFENHPEIELPMIVSQNQLYYKGWVFKKAMQLQSGLIMLYNSPYRVQNFNPALGQFHYGNSTQLASYPTFDIFLNMKIKRVNLFFRTYNLNQGIISDWKGMYAYPNHPLPDRSFKFGFSWAFYD